MHSSSESPSRTERVHDVEYYSPTSAPFLICLVLLLQLLEGKTILQELYRNNHGWENSVPDEIQARWLKEVIEQIPVSDREEGIMHLDFSRDALPMEHTLGVQWCIESDAFKFRISVKDRTCTRRGILFTNISSIFDLLGFVAPVVRRQNDSTRAVS